MFNLDSVSIQEILDAIINHSIIIISVFIIIAPFVISAFKKDQSIFDIIGITKLASILKGNKEEELKTDELDKEIEELKTEEKEIVNSLEELKTQKEKKRGVKK